MLAAFVYEPQPRDLDVLRRVVAEESGLDVVILTDDFQEARRFLTAESGAMLAVCSITDSMMGLTLAQQVQNHNRDSYILLTVDSMDALLKALSGQLRVCGVLPRPVSMDRARALVTHVLSDYRHNHGETGQFLALKTGASVMRIPLRAILYVEAIGKKLEVFTRRQSYTYYESLTDLEKSLGDTFIRCHRSYLVNRAAVVSADFADMMLTLVGGHSVPLSRSQKQAVKDWLYEKTGEAYG